MHGYHVHPIDFWYGWMTLEEYEKNVRSKAWEQKESQQTIEATRELIKVFEKHALDELDWEGDMREGFYLAALPAYSLSGIVIARKQENNGQCFVFSTEPLPWLDDDDLPTCHWEHEQ
jgi:hypothetical protein